MKLLKALFTFLLICVVAILLLPLAARFVCGVRIGGISMLSWGGLLGGSSLLLVIVGIILVAALVSRSGSPENQTNGTCPSPVHSESAPSEADLLRQINEGLARMDRRIEALETLIVDEAGGQSSRSQARGSDFRGDDFR